MQLYINISVWAAIFLYLFAIGIIIFFEKKERTSSWMFSVLVSAFALHSFALILRSVLTRHSPMANLYETLLFFSWAIVLSHIIVILRYKEEGLGKIVLPVAFIVLVVSNLAPKNAGPLPLALKTWWFELHVISSFAAYALYTLSFAAAVKFLTTKTGKDIHLDICQRGMLWGFALFTFAMFSGGIWGYLAWGSYWLWEPKTIWSFILWFYYGGAIHLFYTKGFNHRGLAWGSVIGFILLLFTYMGVSILMQSSHTMV